MFKYIRDHFFKKVRRAVSLEPCANDVIWVVTVPAIWDNAAKQLMRHAAKAAGLCHDREPQRLRIVHEPEAAGIFCTGVDSSRLRGDSRDSPRRLKKGDRVLIVDCGGGTVDVSVLEKLAGEGFKTCVPASGGPWGANIVSQAIWGLLEQAVGKTAVEQWQKEDPEGFVELQYLIEQKKHAWDGSTDSSLVFNVPFNFVDALEEMDINFKSKIEKLAEDLGENLVFRRGRLTIGGSLVSSIFKRSTDPICQHLKYMHRNRTLAGVSVAYLVGGFANSSVLQQAVRKQLCMLNDAIDVLIPLDASSSIMKGAVQMTTLWTHGLDVIAARVSAKSYGMAFDRLYDPVRDSGRRTKQSHGRTYCVDCFDPFVRAGDEVPNGFTHREQYLYSQQQIKKRKSIDRIFSSTNRNVNYIDDTECSYEGSITYTIPDNYTVEDGATATTVMLFGDTEIKVVVIDDKSQVPNETTVDFLSTSG